LQILWPGGVFITKTKKNEEGVADSQKGMEQQPASFESQLEAARCARVVYEALVGELHDIKCFFLTFLGP
jgi:hypothetical protein